MKYMFLLNRTTDAFPEPGTAEFDQTTQAYGAALEAAITVAGPAT